MHEMQTIVTDDFVVWCVPVIFITVCHAPAPCKTTAHQMIEALGWTPGGTTEHCIVWGPGSQYFFALRTAKFDLNWPKIVTFATVYHARATPSTNIPEIHRVYV